MSFVCRDSRQVCHRSRAGTDRPDLGTPDSLGLARTYSIGRCTRYLYEFPGRESHGREVGDGAGWTAVEEQAWERIDVSDWPLRGVETVGSSRAEWLGDPATGLSWLHKDTVVPDTGIEQGEDWAEVVATQVAQCLGVPAAATQLCWRGGRRGSLSLSIVPQGYALYEGTIVLETAEAPGYFPHREGEPGRDPARPGVKRPGHTLANIFHALKDVAPPPGFDGPELMSGFDAFVGYMVLDALIANRDRHEQNWAVLSPQLLTSQVRLSPSYDHAGGLGYNLDDPKRRSCIDDHARLEKWAAKGTCHRFEHEKRPMTLVEHARNAVDLCSSEGAAWWRQRIEDIDLDPVLTALRERAISEMSDPAATFAHDLLILNLGRLRDALRQRD